MLLVQRRVHVPLSGGMPAHVDIQEVQSFMAV